MSSFCLRIRSNNRSRGPSYSGSEILRSTMVVTSSLVRQSDSLGPLVQAARPFRASDQWDSLAACAVGHFPENLINIIQVARKIITFSTHGNEITPVVFEQGFLQIPVPQASRTKAIFEVSCDISGRDKLHQLDREISVRIRLWLLRGPAIHDNAHNLFSKGVLVTENLDRIPITLTHLLAVGTWYDGNLFEDLRFGNHEGLAIKIVELDGDVPGHFDVLFLIAADRNNIRVERENVCSH